MVFCCQGIIFHYLRQANSYQITEEALPLSNYDNKLYIYFMQNIECFLYSQRLYSHSLSRALGKGRCGA